MDAAKTDPGNVGLLNVPPPEPAGIEVVDTGDASGPVAVGW
jgi:hypothetical protein